MMTLEEHKRIVKLINACKSGGDDVTPHALVEEMISQIPEEVFINPNSKFLDPGAGSGTFLLTLYYKLVKYHTHDHIINNMLYGIDNKLWCVTMLSKKVGLKNIYKQDFLTFKTNMKFDVVIGNPPYNDIKDSKAKRNSSKEGQANLYKRFISRASSLLDENGTLIYLLPPGATKEFYKNKLFLHKVTLVPNNSWPKPIQTRIWYSTKIPTNNVTITNPVLSKVLEYAPQRILGRESNAGIKAYNYTRPLSILTKTDYNRLDKKEQSKYAVGFYLQDLPQNKTNLHTLLEYFQLFLDDYAKQWHSYNKTLKYQWLEGLQHNITEQDIIEYYGLTKEEIKIVKSRVKE
jgi:hypothetical protein